MTASDSSLVTAEVLKRLSQPKSSSFEAAKLKKRHRHKGKPLAAPQLHRQFLRHQDLLLQQQSAEHPGGISDQHKKPSRQDPHSTDPLDREQLSPPQTRSHQSHQQRIQAHKAKPEDEAEPSRESVETEGSGGRGRSRRMNRPPSRDQSAKRRLSEGSPGAGGQSANAPDKRQPFSKKAKKSRPITLELEVRHWVQVRHGRFSFSVPWFQCQI